MDNQIYGWFEDASDHRPSYDPPHDGPCLHCGRPIDPANDVRTHSIMAAGEEYAKRSYFFRTHRTCADAADGSAMDELVFGMISRNGD